MSTPVPAPEALQEDVTAEVSAESLDPLIGVTIDGRFRIVGGIGKGAMGRVYRAVQVPLNRAVALKVLDSNYGAGKDESFRQRFLVEAALTGKLSHPNTVRIYDYGCTADGIFYLAMEYLAGETLDRALAKGPIGWRRVLSMGQQMARALREAHELGVVHRDLKPANVMLLSADDDTDHVKVLDFGLVKSFVEGQELEGRAITQQGMLMGSPPYMAPEQGDKNRADPRSDIYSLGCILFECLTGKPPYPGVMPLEIILKHVNDPVPAVKTPPNFEPVPDGMSALVTKCLQKSPMDRFQSMDEVLQAMSELLAPVLTPAFDTPMPPPEAVPELPRPPPVPPRSTTLLLVLGFAFALLVGIGGTLLVLRRPAPRAVEVPPPAAAQPLTVQFHIETQPAGAQVLIGKVVKGVTPLDLELPAVGGRAQAEVTLQKDGFLPMTLTTAGSGPRIELSQKLQPRSGRPEPKPAPEAKVDKPAAAVKSEPVAEPKPVIPAPVQKAAEPPRPSPAPTVKVEKPAEPAHPVLKVEKSPTPPKPATSAALPVVTPVKPVSRPPPLAKKPAKPASPAVEDPMAPHTPPPSNDLKRPR